jgi:hypothetical protein
MPTRASGRRLNEAPDTRRSALRAIEALTHAVLRSAAPPGDETRATHAVPLDDARERMLGHLVLVASDDVVSTVGDGAADRRVIADDLGGAAGAARRALQEAASGVEDRSDLARIATEAAHGDRRLGDL